jgi:transcriptional regulator with XRE-family HTH domain
MSTQFAHDLRLARRKAGYTQKDIAHLLSSHQSLVSDFEHGRKQPNLEQIIELSLIYGRSFESFFAQLMDTCQDQLRKRLERLPTLRKQTAETFHRANSLRRLKRRLTNPPPYGDT